MRIRIVVADESEARFYDATSVVDELRPAGKLSETAAHLKDRDLASDRPGRVFDRAPPASGRRGAVGHHATDGERSPRKEAACHFAHQVAGKLEEALDRDRYERLVVMAGPPFLGMLRAELSKRVRQKVVAEVPKDLVHQPDGAVRVHLPRVAFELSAGR